VANWGSTTVLKIPGVYHCDPNCRTHDLGKWNISCHLDKHPAICTWIDENMVTIWKQIPLELSPVITFPEPERLSEGRHARGSGMSVTSGLTNASPVAAYTDSLEKNTTTDTDDAATRSSRNAWKTTVPVEDVSYSFTLNAFPKLANETTTATTADEASLAAGRDTCQATAVSAIMEGFVSSAVKTSISALDEHRKTESANFTECLNNLEDRLQGITDTIDSLSEKLTDAVILRLTKPDGLITQQNQQLTEQSVTMTKMYQMLETLTDNFETMTTDRGTERSASPSARSHQKAQTVVSRWRVRSPP
jgi:uncharacterized coiled-coil protein SlyX